MNWLHIGYILRATSMTSSLRKLIEILVNVFQKSSPMQSTTMVTSSQIELVVTTTKEPKSIRGGVELVIVPYTYFYPKNLWKYLLFLAIR
jgi:hypothetical protein